MPINLASTHIALRWSAGTLALEFLQTYHTSGVKKSLSVKTSLLQRSNMSIEKDAPSLALQRSAM